MRNIFTKKVLVIISVVSVALAMGSVAYAGTALRQITAYQNQDLKVRVNGSLVDMSSEDGTMYPLVYDGHSYVSAKALAEKLGATVSWNNDTQTVEVSTNGYIPADAGAPTKDNTTTKPSTTPSTTTPSSGAYSGSGKLGSPVPLGKSFTYVDNYNAGDGKWNNTSATYNYTVNNVTPLSLDQIVALGFRRPDTSTTVSYVMANVTVKASKIKFTQGNEKGSLDHTFLSSIKPDIWGTKSLDGEAKIIGGTDYGFDGSFSRLLQDDYFTEFKEGETGSYEMTGDILLTVLKGQESMLALHKQDSDIEEYEDTFVYFKLK